MKTTDVLDTNIPPKPTDSASLAIQEALSRIDPVRRPSVAKRAKDVPVKARPGYLRAATGDASPRQAIKAFCSECVCWDRQEVTLCTALACPLFAYRPFVGKRDKHTATAPDTEPLGDG